MTDIRDAIEFTKEIELKETIKKLEIAKKRLQKKPKDICRINTYNYLLESVEKLTK